MIELIATAESVEQGKTLIDQGIDSLVIGEGQYGLRLPYHFTREEMRELCAYAHLNEAKIVVAMNAILHNDDLISVRDYLLFLKEIQVDQLMVGDTGLIQVLKDEAYYIPFIYDASVLLTSPGQVDFWAKYGAVKAMVAREVPFVEMKEMVQATLPLVVQVYGASCIHQSKRKLVKNYLNFVEKDPEEAKGRHLFLSEPKKDDTHYSIYEDQHGTHVFANNDLNLIAYLEDLQEIGITNWYLDGIYTPGENFVEIARVFCEARDTLLARPMDEMQVAGFLERIEANHPVNRETGTGFFLYEAGQVK